MKTEENNRLLHEILGLHWHEWVSVWGWDDSTEQTTCNATCKSCKKNKYHSRVSENLDFYSDAGTIQLLRELEKQEWYGEFIVLIGGGYCNYDCIDAVDGFAYKKNWEIPIKYITTPGLLADKVLEWRNENGR